MGEADGPEGAGTDERVGLARAGAVALLEAEGDVEAALGGVGGAHDALAAFDVCPGGLFDVDVLAGLDGGFEVLGVEEDGGGDDDGVHVALEQVFVVAVGAGVFEADLGFGAVDALVHDVAEGDDACAGVLRDEGGIEGAAAAGADEPTVTAEFAAEDRTAPAGTRAPAPNRARRDQEGCIRGIFAWSGRAAPGPRSPIRMCRSANAVR